MKRPDTEFSCVQNAATQDGASAPYEHVQAERLHLIDIGIREPVYETGLGKTEG
jgi:hypothetical protein